MGDRLKGKRAFVTAGAAGIGRACAIAFAREGATVIATDIDEKGLALLAGDGVSEAARLDVRDSAAVAAMARQVGAIDILLNAGHAAIRPRLDREHRLGGRRVQGRAQSLRLWRD
jgi:2-keto-3-deoxy-L-fuconate dehydrogenase